MIFVLFSIMWGRIQDQTTNFEHLVHETWPRTCVWSIFKFYKKQTKSKNHETCQDIICGGCDKKLRRFRASCHVRCLQIEVGLFTKSISWRGRLRFASIVCDNLRETFSNFYHSLHIWYHDILTSFMIFELRLLFIEFKNNSIVSSWSCFVNKMFEIGGLFLDTASHYTK